MTKPEQTHCPGMWGITGGSCSDPPTLTSYLDIQERQGRVGHAWGRSRLQQQQRGGGGGGEGGGEGVGPAPHQAPIYRGGWRRRLGITARSGLPMNEQRCFAHGLWEGGGCRPSHRLPGLEVDAYVSQKGSRRCWDWAAASSASGRRSSCLRRGRGRLGWSRGGRARHRRPFLGCIGGSGRGAQG